MAQRILLGFDALDKYSQDILAKHAKKRSLSYLQTIASLRIPLSLDFEAEIDQDPDERTNSGKPSSPRSLRYPINTESGKTVNLQRFTATGRCFSPGSKREEREQKKRTKPRCVSAKRRSWRSEVESIPNLDTLCHMEQSGLVLSSRAPYRSTGSTQQMGAPFIVSSRRLLQDSETAVVVEKSEVPLCGDDMKPENMSPLPDTCGWSRVQNITDNSHLSSENTQKAAAASVCMGDGRKKSDIKITTVRQKTISGQVQNISETHPIVYNHHINFSDFRRNLITRPYYFSSSQQPVSKPFSPMGPHLQKKTDCTIDFLKNKQLGSQDAMVKKSKSNKAPSLDNIKVILHYLSADGTKQRVEMAKDKNVAEQKRVNNPGNTKNSIQSSKQIPISPNNEKQGVGLVINGINPMTMDHTPSFHGRSHYVSRLFCPNSSRTSSSPNRRHNNNRELHNWSYISISKPLSAPEGPPQPLKKKSSATTCPDLVKGMAVPTPRMMLTTKSVMLENSNLKPGSFHVDSNPTGTYLGCKRSTEGSQEDRTVESTSDSRQTCTSPKSELLEVASSKNESHEEQIQKHFPIPIHFSITPVINIPTATVDSTE
ncbi:uncharacterized protein [Eleutherodactylus coqui]